MNPPLCMSDRGKYHGQRLKAKDVLRLYAAGERDFRGTILRGCNFREVDLSEADFRNADIRSAKFLKINLASANFSHAQGGKAFWSDEFTQGYFILKMVLRVSRPNLQRRSA